MINYALPGLYSQYELNKKLISLKETSPYYFYENVGIDAVYGIFPFCIWDGGRVFHKYSHCTIEKIDEIVEFFNSHNIPVRLVCTNTQLQEKDYYNRFGNLILQHCENNLNQIVVSDDKFQEYIKNNYPKFNFISSTTKCLNLNDFKAELDKTEYKQICLDYNLNNSFELFKGLTSEQIEKCEFLINAICPPGCPNRKEHYKLNSLFYLTYGRNYKLPQCLIQGNTVSNSCINYKNNMSYGDIKDKYEPLGFKHFKLEGRTLSSLEVACNYIRYMIKPEYQLEVLNILEGYKNGFDLE